MSTDLKFPVTQKELADMAQGAALVRMPATFEEYWELLETAEYRLDYYDREIIASPAYESSIHSIITTLTSFLIFSIFQANKHFRVHNSNRPICIPACENAVFNPDGSVVTVPGQLYEYQPGMNAELNPVILFEVLSKTTRTRDLGEKMPCYKKVPTLRQIIYIDSERVSVTVNERLEGDAKWLETMYESMDQSFLIDEKPVMLRDIYGDIFQQISHAV